MALDAVRVAELEEALGAWLVESPIRVHEGTHKGGILGWLSHDQNALHIYPEAAGYYLTTMRFMMHVSPERAGRAAAALNDTFEWLERSTSRGYVPRTRVYLTDGLDDWRNNATFAFDCAIIARGIAAAADLVGPARARAVLRPFIDALRTMLSARTIAPFVGVRKGIRLPARWSTEDWVHHVKLAAAVDVCRRDPWVAESIPVLDGVVERWRGILTAPLPEGAEIHPWLYGIEGLFLLGLLRRDPSFIDDAFIALNRVCSIASDGWIPSTSNGGARRSDVQAQVLRLAVACRFMGRKPDSGAVSLALNALAEHVTASGAVAFQLPSDIDDPHLNSWAAMFAYQAIALLKCSEDAFQPCVFLELLA